MAKKFKYIGSKAVNKDSLPSFSVFNDTFQTTIFNGGIKLSTKFATNQQISREKRIIITQKDVTLNDLKINNIAELNNFIKITNKLKLNLDTVNLSNYAVYGSLKEKFRVAVNNIINKFPGGLAVKTYLSGVSYFNILDYTYDSANNISTFRSPITIIDNPFFLNLYSNSNLSSSIINNVTTRYLDYVLLYNNIDYGINGFTGFSNSNSSYLYFSINGNPFGAFSANSISDEFVIKPNDIEFNKFYNSLNELERYFLNKNANPKYSFDFKIPEIDEDDDLTFINYTFQFPVKGDGYNLDTDSLNYVDLLEKLFSIGDLYDEYKSNLIIRKFIPKTLIDFDGTDSFKSESMFKIYGKEIDEIKLFIDSLMSINTVTYDKINNIPDTLIKNLARTLGWKAQNIINDKDLLSSVFANDRSGDTDISASLAEVDIELWRRLTINTAWFLKSKGTRKAIETIFTFIGAPDCLISFDEHVYVVDSPISARYALSNLIGPEDNTLAIPPYDENGFPIAPSVKSSQYFQVSGNTDSGQEYINIYRRLGYNVTKTVDNKKAWVYYESANTHSSSGRNTNYNINDSRLIINTKEVTINIDAARAIECDVYNFNQDYNYPVSSTGRTSPYPQRSSNIFGTTQLTFAEYVQEIYSKFINAQNRKVTESAIGSHYPSLTKLYYDYYSNNNSNKRNFADLNKYIDNLDNIFDTFVKQFIPATTIFNDSAFNIRNSVFTPQKYAYKHGIDDGSEFEVEIQLPIETDVSLVSIESEFFDTFDNDIPIATIESSVSVSDNGNIDTDFFANVEQNVNLSPLWNSKVCENEKSSFALTGATKIELSSLTQTSIFNKTTETGHTLTFNFTSATSTLSANTTLFYYSIHKYDRDIGGFSETSVYTAKTLGYTAFTGSSILTNVISGSYLSCDSEYIIKPYFEYTTCLDTGTTITIIPSSSTVYEYFIISGYPYQSFTRTTYEFIEPSTITSSIPINVISSENKLYSESNLFFNYNTLTANTGSNITTLINKTAYTPSFNYYNKLDDYYFVSLCEPEKPVLSFPSTRPDDQSSLFVETIPVTNDVFSSFTITYEPIGEVLVSVNGLTLQKNLEYSNDASITITSIRNRSFTLSQSLIKNQSDVLTVAYYRNVANTQQLVKEDLLYTGSSQIVSASTGFYEITLSKNRINNSDIAVFANGSLLMKNTDYQVSSYDDNKVILLFQPPTNPITISVSYLSNFLFDSSTLIEATGPNYTVNWSLNNIISNNQIGKFVHQFYDLANTGLTGTTLYSAETAYAYNTTQFSNTFGWQSVSLTPGTTYYYRISSEKYFTTINNINLSSVTYSETYRLKIPL